MITIILLVTVLVLAVLSFTKFEIRKEIEITAPIDRVWRTILDFHQYSRWNSQLTFLGGDVKPNGRLHLKLAASGAKPYEFKPIISHWQDHKKFAWLAITGFPRLFDGEHFFELTQLTNGNTLLINREEYRGILSLVIRNLPMMKDAPAGFEIMNQELKRFIETNK